MEPQTPRLDEIRNMVKRNDPTLQTDLTLQSARELLAEVDALVLWAARPVDGDDEATR